MPRLKNSILTIALLLTAGAAPAQTVVTWGGGFPNDNFSTAANWLPSPPLNDGSEILAFDTNSDGSLFLNSAANFLGISVVGGYGFGTDATFRSTNSISIGAMGIQVQDGGGGSTSSVQFNQNVHVILAAPQTWDLGTASNSLTVVGTITDTGGAPALTLSAADCSFATFTFLSGNSTFTGGVTVQGMGTGVIVGASSTGTYPSVTKGPLGTGNLTLGDGTQLTTNTFNPVTIGNSVMLGDDSNGAPITLGGSTTRSNPGNVNLTLSGPISLYLPDEEIDVGSNSRVTLSGAVSGPSYCLDFGGQGTASGSLAIVTGPVSISRLDLEDSGAVIFDGGPSQLTLGYNIGTQPYSYVGTGSSYSGSVATFLAASKIDLNASSFSGTLGLDTVSGPSATFGDAIDLTGFTGGSFVGLGSATSAISTGTITPPGGLGLMSGTSYLFGGGGGTLYVAGPLQDSSYYDGEVYVPESNNVQLNPGNSPLTLVLRGSLTYTGTTSSEGGALVFDTPVSTGSGAGSFYVGGETAGYIGYTENAGLTPSTFLSLINEGSVNGVIGFDSHNPGSPVVLSGVTIDLTQGNLAPFNSNTYLGTATRATLDNTTTIIPVAGIEYKFAGVKGGWLTVDTNLGDYTNPSDSLLTNSVVIGLPEPMESFGSQSSVTLGGDNTYSGGTTLKSGYLYVTNSNSIGTGPLVVPNPLVNRGWAATLAAFGGAVSLSNPIFLPNSGLALNTASSSRLTLTGPIQNYAEDNGSLGIFGPVDLNGANTYSGGTTISVSPSTVINVGSNTGLSYGPVTAFGGTINFTSLAPQLNNLQISGSTLNFLGSPLIGSLQMAQSTINFADGTIPQIDGLSGDSNASGNVINLGTVTGAALTLSLGGDPDFGGTINGPGSLAVYGNDLNLSGNNTYAGGTRVGGGATVIASSNSALGTGGVVVDSNGTLVTNIGVTLHNGITFNDGGTIAGFGTFSPGGSLAFQNGSKLIPGAVIIGSGSGGNGSIPAIGRLTFGGGTSLTFGSGGNMAFSLTDANGPAGTGYSTVSVSGGLTITNSGSPFNVYLFSYAPGTNIPEATPAANFNPALPYQWTLLSTTTGITGFAANDFSINTSYSGAPTFLNSTGVGSFFVSEVGNDLMLNFTPVPEPTSLALMASGLCALGAAFRRRRR